MASVLPRGRLGKTRLLALTALFASIHGLSSAVPGPWGPPEVARSFVIFVESIEGIALGPLAGFLSSSIGCVLGRILRPREEGFLLSVSFGMGEAFAALVAGSMFKKRWFLALAAYSAMLLAFLADPLTRSAGIPLWALWNTFAALLLIPPTRLAVKKAMGERGGAKRLGAAVCMVTFVSTEADMLFRIFLLVPMRFYLLYPIPIEFLPAVFVVGALVTPIEAALSTLVAAVLAVPALKAISKSTEWPVT
ncbi:MAG: hypothetical protein JTT11_01045 [Candidatus Brockarchaeota archaeon]|nr:hypothetical protein [Candidatus Brockarchaeota archaeon]